MRKALVVMAVICVLYSASFAYADTLIIPFSCYPKEVQKQLEIAGYKFDLDKNDRTRESFGYIENEGTKYKLITYYPLTEVDLVVIQRTIMTGA